MDLQESVRTCFAKYVDFHGEASRSEYWWFIAFIVVVGFALALVSHLISELFCLLTAVPSLAAATRRLHDTNRSGWWLWLIVLGPIGLAVLAFFLVQEGDVKSRASA
jgi:uncharacterized membrane protein YhaH (DUF805 family)